MSESGQPNDSPSAPRRRRRWGCLAFILLWLCVAGASLTAGLLAVQGDIVVPRGELRETRVWQVTEEGNRGLGVSTARFVSGSEAEEMACVETRVAFLLWQAGDDVAPARYCECYARDGGAWTYSGVCE